MPKLFQHSGARILTERDLRILKELFKIVEILNFPKLPPSKDGEKQTSLNRRST